MSTHHFTLIVDGPDLQSDVLINALFEAGCNDATVGRTEGIQFLDFDREAASLVVAILSAVNDVERVDGVDVVEIVDADIPRVAVFAASVGRIREAMRILFTDKSGRVAFSYPVRGQRSRHRVWEAKGTIVQAGPPSAIDPPMLDRNRSRAGVTHYYQTITP